MANQILVAYATKYGSTAEIAEKIGGTLRQRGFLAEVISVENVGTLNACDAIVLGSAVYAGQWQKEAVAFLEAHEGELSERPVWIFSSGPTGEGDPVELMKGWKFPEVLQPFVERIKPIDIAFFHGRIDLTKLNFGEKLIVKALKAPTGDFRDWGAITDWAESIADALEAYLGGSA
jgi:menaquinone-dependent protoporphyrinogen oxidase